MTTTEQKMAKVVDFSEYKAKKRLEVIEHDLEDVIALLNLMYQSLGNYKKYSPINSILFEILNQKTLLYAHLKKCRALRGSNDQVEKSKN